MFEKLQFIIFLIIFINSLTVRTINLSDDKIKHAIEISSYNLLNRNCLNEVSSTYITESMTPFTEVRLGCLPHKIEKLQIYISICYKGPCVDPSSGKKIRNTYIEPIKRRIRINENDLASNWLRVSRQKTQKF